MDTGSWLRAVKTPPKERDNKRDAYVTGTAKSILGK